MQCRFDTVLVFPTTASFQNALCLSPPLPEGSINFSMLVNDQSLYEEVALTVISSPVIHSVAHNLSTTRLNVVSFLGSYPDSFNQYFTCHFNCNFEEVYVSRPDFVTKTLVMCPLPHFASSCAVAIKVDNVSSNIFQMQDHTDLQYNLRSSSFHFARSNQTFDFHRSFLYFLRLSSVASFAGHLICLFATTGMFASRRYCHQLRIYANSQFHYPLFGSEASFTSSKCRFCRMSSSARRLTSRVFRCFFCSCS